MAFPKIGSPAPKFSLKNQNDDIVKLSDMKGQSDVVIYFYPKAMTPGCTVQACGIRDTVEEFSKRDIVVLAISPDPVAKLGKFVGKHDLNFTLLSDEDHLVTEQYGCWGLKKFMGREFMGVLRTTFIVNKEGRLMHIMDKVKTKTHHDDVLNLLSQIG